MAISLADMRIELGGAMASAGTGFDAANALCDACVDLLGIDGAAISMVHDGFPHGTFGASSEASRRLDEYQFTFGEGPCLDAAASHEVVLAPDLDSPHETRWPAFAEAALEDGVRAVFALPIRITSGCVGAMDLFREGPGPLRNDQLAGGVLAAELASLPLLDLIASTQHGPGDEDDPWAQLAELDRVEVYQATGMLISQLDVDATEALIRLRAHAIASGTTASQVALAIIGRRLVLERDSRDDNGRSG
ncbi:MULTISPECIES: GAF and ANTAR domain-containing protein [unclassified Knoellia]|uniref:GAF and ANTAR domain-containing protein n=1 Tax=Knoellia altitudinis TaxID=3404795 RepID=UPI00360C643A